MNRSKKLVGGLTLAGAMMVTGVVGFAQQGTMPHQGGTERAERKMRRGSDGDRGMHGMMGMGGFARTLNLTDAQKQQMEQISTRYRETFKSLRQQEEPQRGGDVDGFTSETFNESAVRAAAQKRANARVEMEVAHARMMSEMYAVLTPEQKAQLATERQQREQKRQEWRSRRQAESGQSL